MRKILLIATILFVLLFAAAARGYAQENKQDDQPSRLEKVLHRVSQGMLAGTLVWDMTSTADLQRYSTAGGCINGAVLCSVADFRPSTVYKERGWTAQLFGEQSVSTVIAENVALTVGIALFDQYAFTKGGRKMRTAATILNFVKATGHLVAAIDNTQKIHRRDLALSVGSSIQW